MAEITDNEHPVREGVEVAGHHALVGMSQCEDLVQVQQDPRKIARHESDHDAHEQQSSLVLDHPARVAILRTIRRLLTDQSMRSKKMVTLGAGTRSRIQARLSGMNTYYARISKLVSDFLYLKRSLVHTLAQLGWLRTESQAD